ncbi:MAG: CoA transferase, partial [Lentisphaerota bacterium]
MTMKQKGIFTGLKVADFSWYAAGPLAAKVFADFGATVVRIESTKRPDTLRILGPFRDAQRLGSHNRSGYWNELNSSKYSVTLDLNKPEGREVAHRFVKWADIVTESNTPGVMAKFGLDYESIRQTKPEVIMFSASGQGQYGPNARNPMYGHIVVGVSGISHFVGWPDLAPAGPYGPWTDFYTPYIVVGITNAALEYRDKTGKGQYIDAAHTETAAYGCLGSSILDLTVNGREQTRMGNRHPLAAPHAAYQCQGEDRWVDIAVFTDEEWQAFKRVLGEPEWTKEPRFATLTGRKEHEDELNGLVQQWTLNYSPEEVMV